MSEESEINGLKLQLERAQRELSSYKVAAAQVGNHLAEISRLNQEISRSRREIDLVLKTTSDAMRLVDCDFNVIWVNAAMEQFCGSDSLTLKKKKCYDVIRSIRCGAQDCLLTV
jgi:PAS domain-containing protein